MHKIQQISPRIISLYDTGGAHGHVFQGGESIIKTLTEEFKSSKTTEVVMSITNSYQVSVKQFFKEFGFHTEKDGTLEFHHINREEFEECLKGYVA